MLLSLFSSGTFGCQVASSGPKYDHLIKVVKLPEKNKYKVTIPNLKRKLLLVAPTAALVYSTKTGSNIYPRNKYRRKRLELNKNDDGFFSYFSLEATEKEKIFVHVHWAPLLGGLCGANAKAYVLAAE